MTNRDWYVAKSVAFRVLELFALASWVLGVGLAIGTQNQPLRESNGVNQFTKIIVSGLQ